MSRRKKRRQEVQSVAVAESKVAELRARQALLAEENAAKKLKFIEDEVRANDARRYIYEGFGFGGVSINGQTFVDRRDYMDLQFGLGNRYVLGSSTGFHQTTIQDRHLGRDEPWTVTQDDIAAARGMARLVTTINCPAIGIIENLENYTLKRGCNYVAGEKKNSKPPEGLIAAVQDVVDEFLDDNSWHCNRDREALTRSHVDGETFLGMYPQKNGFTKVRFIEPDQVVQPGMPPFTDLEIYQRWNVIVKYASNWELGIHTPDHDVEHVYGYCLQWDPSGPYDYMPAEHVVHFKRNVPANVKRGRSDFYPAWEWLLDEARLLRNTTSGAARLAAIAYIIQYATASKSEVEGMRRANADYEINLKSSSGTSKTLYREYEIPGERLEVPQGQEYISGPMGAERGQAFLEVCKGILQNCATRWAMTTGMVSGDDSQNNRASAVEAGSRFYNFIEGNQGKIGSFYESVIWKALLFAFRAGRFARFGFAPGGQRGWSDFKRVVQVAIEFPDIDPKQDLERTQKRQLLNGMRAMSIKTIQIQEKLDPEEEAANFKEEMEQQMAQQQAMQGGMGGGLAGMLGGGMPPGGAPGQGGMGPPAPPFGGPTDAAPPSPTAPSASAPEPDPYAQPDAMGESRAVVQESGTRDGAVKGWDTRRMGGFNREEAERETILLDKQIADLEAKRTVMLSSLDKETSKPAIKANPGEVWVDDRSLHGRTVKIEDVNRKRREKTIGGLRDQIKDSDELLEKLKQRREQLQEAIERNQRDVEASRPQVDDAEANAQTNKILDDFAKSDEGQAFLKTLLGESAAVAQETLATLNANSDGGWQDGGVKRPEATDKPVTFDETNPKLRESVQILHRGQVLFSGPDDQAVQILETGYAEYGAAAVEGIVIETAAGQRALGESWLVESEEPDEEGRWVTLRNGRRVFIAPGGMITKGLGTGQHVWNFGKQGPTTVERGKHGPVTIEPARHAGPHEPPPQEHPIKRLTGKVKDAARRFEKWLVGWFKSEDPTARRLLKRRAARAIRANVGLTQISQAKRSVVRDMTRDFVDWIKAQYHDERDIDDVDRLLKARITSIAGESEAQRWEAAELVFEASSEPVRLAVLEGTAQAIREYHQARG